MATLGSFASGQVLTAAELNAIGTWTSYTPTFNLITVGNSTVDFRYTKINKLVIVNGFFTLGSTGSVNGASSMSLPVQAKNSFNCKMGFGQINDVGTATYDLWPLTIGNNATATTLFTTISNGTYLPNREAGISATVPMTWTTGDSFNVTLTYEAL